MARSLVLIMLTLLILVGVPSCLSESESGNVVGVVTREGTGDVVPQAVLIFGRVMQTPLVPDQMIIADEDGKFAITLAAGNYNVKLGTVQAGPYYTWPNAVRVEGNKTSVIGFRLPASF